MPPRLLIESEAREIPLDAARMVIGRGVGVAIPLSDRLVSREHAAFITTPTGYQLRDLNSRNGTFVNGVQIDETPIHSGDVILIGQTSFRFIADSPPASKAEGDEQTIAATGRTTLPPRFNDLYESLKKLDDPSRAELLARFTPASKRLKGEGALGDQRMIGRSRPFKQFCERLRTAAAAESTVLLLGESGTGKELAARAIHAGSPRRESPFVAANCGAFPRDLLESELFGHEKGAFTGAVSARPGLFEMAHRGTLFLDEIGELPLEAQVKLLRVLEDKHVRRLGGTADRPVEVRLLGATHRNLAEQVAQKTFREDLYYRLSVVVLTLPALRERVEDIDLLVDHYVGYFAERMGKRVAGLDEEALKTVKGYAWPGNIRQLRNVIERAVLFATHEQIQLEDIDPVVRTATPVAPGELKSLGQVEREHIQEVLKALSGNKSKAAEVLGISRYTLYEKIRKYALE